MRDGEVDCVAGSAHSALAAFPEWRGVKLLCAQGQGMYWFLVMRSDINPERGDVNVVRGRKIGAAPWVDLGLKQLLVAAGLDEARDNITIAPVPNTGSPSVNFGLTAAKALEERVIDGFWANGMGTEVAVRSGAGTVVLDIRRGDGPKECFNYTMASLAVTDEFLAQRPDDARRAVTAMEDTHAALKNDVSLAAQVGRKVFPEREASLIAALIERDLPYYSTEITPRLRGGDERIRAAPRHPERRSDLFRGCRRDTLVVSNAALSVPPTSLLSVDQFRNGGPSRRRSATAIS